MMTIAVMEKGEKKMSMRDYEDMKDIVIPKEQEEMMNIICDAWDECRTLNNCKECPDRPKEYMRMMMCTSLKYTRKFIEAGYTKQPTEDVQEVRHGRWEPIGKNVSKCTVCGCARNIRTQFGWNFCPVCGAKMSGDER